MILLNEKEYAERCLKEKVIDGKPYFTLSILAKYYHNKGYKRKKIIELLTDFMDKSYSRYAGNKSEWRNSIETIAKNANKYPLYEIDGVWITESEIQTISSLNNQSLEQLLFTMLCIAKLNRIKNPNNEGWVNTSAKEIFELARVSCSSLKRNEVIGALYDLGLLDLPKDNVKLSVKVKFIDDASENKLFVSDFRELGYEWLYFRGGKFIRCQECGILTRYTKNRKYCKNCASQEPQEIKSVVCVDCGKRFEVNARNTKTCRCSECNDAYMKEYYRDFKRKQRENDKNVQLPSQE